MNRLSSIFSPYRFTEKRTCLHKFSNHVLVFVYSGELKICEQNSMICLRKGDSAFISKNNRLFMTGIPENEGNFHLLFLTIPCNFLCEFYHAIDRKKLLGGINQKKVTLSKLFKHVEITSLFKSFIPYLEQDMDIPEELTYLKMAEAVYALIHMENQFHSTLFDFSKPNNLSMLDVLRKSCNTDLQWISRQPTFFYDIKLN